MERIDTRARSDAYGSKINREHSWLLATIVPYTSILLASILPILPIATALPLMPPLAFLLLLAWRMIRPGLLPIWIGVPLGLFDDLYSGQPFGSGILLWSLAMIALEALEGKMRWRNFMLDWLTAAGIVTVYILVASLFSGASTSEASLIALIPQIVLSIMIYPILARIVSRLDRFRLMRIKVIG